MNNETRDIFSRGLAPLSVCLLALSAFACSSGGGSADNGDVDDTVDVYELASVPSSKQDTSIGTVYTADEGLTLYTFENDTAGVSNCYDDCANIWPPLYAADSAQPSGDFSIVTRNDGSRQWAFKQYPLYFYYLDENPGDINGEGIKGVWFVARPNPWQELPVDASAQGLVFAGQHSVLGVDNDGVQQTTRVDREGFTLYTFVNDDPAPGTSSCNDGCAAIWPPLYAERGARASGDFSIIDRNDTTRQWAFKGYPLYFYAGDSAAGQTNGEAVNDIWYVARPDPLQILSSAIGSVFAGKGSVFGVDADGNQTATRSEREGFTLYTFDGDTVGAGTSACNGNPCAVVWPPLYADIGAKPNDVLSVITRQDGTSQWAYKGRPLYFFNGDVNPGDSNGDGISPAGLLWFAARNAPVQLSVVDGHENIFEARGEIADVDADGHQALTSSDKTGFSLYTFDVDVAGSGRSLCNGSCASTWPPLYADDTDQPAGDFSIINRDDGSLQWAYKGLPLYFFAPDTTPGSLNGLYTDWSAATL